MLRLTAVLLALCSLVGCEKKWSSAIVLEKEHIAAAPRAAESPTPTTSLQSVPTTVADKPSELAPDEIVVDGYVMKALVRGTERDPRAMTDEQWLVKVQTSDNGRVFNVHAQERQFEKLKVGDRVEVSYRVGKYTNTVWTSDLR